MENWKFDVSDYEPLPAMHGLFITGTDTDVGKTLIAGAIARSLRLSGTAVEVFKPVASACRHTREGLVSSDAEFLAACADSSRPLHEITPVRYASALAPNVAADRENRPVDLEAVFQTYRSLAEDGETDFVIVEGVGGLLCPLSDDFWIIHLAKLIALPLVIVARPGLGTINHTLLTIHAARSAGLRIAGVVINRYPHDLLTAADSYLPACGDADISILTNPQQIALRGKVPILAIVGDEKENSIEKATISPQTQFTINQLNWKKIAESISSNR